MTKNSFNMHSLYLILGLTMLSIVILTGLFFKASRENDRLTWKIDRMESEINCSHDRLRLIFFKNRAEFTEVAEYLKKNYGNSFYSIAYENGNIIKQGSSVRQDDAKFIKFFEFLQKDVVLYKERLGSDKMVISHSNNEEGENMYKPVYVGGIDFYLYQNMRHSGVIKYRNTKEFDRVRNSNEYMTLYSSFSVIDSQWSSVN